MVFDLIMAAIVVLLAIVGALRGLIRQVFGILGFVGGIILARLFAGPLAEQYHGKLGVSITVAAIGFSFVLFFATEIVARLLGAAIHTLFGLTPITGGLNRLGGLALGAAKGLLLVWAVASLAALLEPHLRGQERKAPLLASLDLPHSQTVAWAKDQNALGDKAKDLRARAEKELRTLPKKH